MPDPRRPARLDTTTACLLSALIGSAACAARTRPTALPDAEAAVVAVRTDSNSPTISVVGWDPAETAFGLRATLRRNGSVVDDHRLFVSTYFFPDYRPFVSGSAAWHAFTDGKTQARPLPIEGVTRDIHACEGDSGCSPYETVNLRLPEAFLRAGRDDMVVVMHSRDGRQETLTLSRGMIDAYLARVAAVASGLRRRPDAPSGSPCCPGTAGWSPWSTPR